MEKNESLLALTASESASSGISGGISGISSDDQSSLVLSTTPSDQKGEVTEVPSFASSVLSDEVEEEDSSVSLTSQQLQLQLQPQPQMWLASKFRCCVGGNEASIAGALTPVQVAEALVTYQSLYSLSATLNNGETIDMERFRGKVLYAVNVASK